MSTINSMFNSVSASLNSFTALSTDPPPPPPPPGGGTQSVDFTQFSGIVGSALGGGVATLKTMGNLKLIGQGMKGVSVPTVEDGEPSHTTIGGGVGSKMKGFGMGVKQLGGNAITGAKYGALIGGGISALANGYNVLTGKTTGAEAAGTFAADTVTATMSGAGGALAGGMTALGLSALGLGSLPVTILAAGIGLAGAVGTHFLSTKTGLYDSIKNGVKGLMGGSTPAPAP